KSRRKLRVDYKAEVNWNDPDSVQLLPDIYLTEESYDAVGKISSQKTPDGSLYLPKYDLTGWLKKVELVFPDNSKQTFIENIDYDAAGQRQRIHFSNQVETDYTYEWETQRLIKIHTTRPATNESNNNQNPVLQNISYTFDPVGNITHCYDHTFETVFCD